MNGHVLIHAEDPGAMNFLKHVPGELAAQNIESTVILDGAARGYAGQLGIASSQRIESGDVEHLFSRTTFDLILIGTSENKNSRAFEYVQEAKRRRIASAGVVDLPINAAHRFSGTSDNPLTFAPDTILAGDPETVEAFEHLGVPPQDIVLVQNPRFSELMARRNGSVDRTLLRSVRYPNVETIRPIVVFAAEPVNVTLPERSYRRASYSFSGRGTATWRTTIILEELLDALALRDPRPYVIIRLHPKNQRNDFASYHAEVNEFNQGGDPMELLMVANLVVGMSSMLLQESQVLGVSTLSLLPRSEEIEWLPMLRAGLIPVALDRESLRRKVNALLTQPQSVQTQLISNAGTTVTDFVMASIASRHSTAET